MRASHKRRRLKIGYTLYYPYCRPRLTIQGKWLAAAGFKIGDYVHIEVEGGRLIIALDPDSERTRLAEEIKALSGKLSSLKEREAEYGKPS